MRQALRSGFESDPPRPLRSGFGSDPPPSPPVWVRVRPPPVLPVPLGCEDPILSRREPGGAVPSLRWLMCYWLAQRGSLFVADWDESDAFCNVPREDTSALLGDIAPRLGTWLQRFYGNLRIRTATPHGLTDPFRMAHGGGQGDSGGVGAYLAVGGHAATAASSSSTATRGGPPNHLTPTARTSRRRHTTPGGQSWRSPTATIGGPWPSRARALSSC